jgi:sulfonate transport system ATP-binding protein
MDNEIKVTVNHMTKKFGDLLVLNDVSFEVKKGEFLCIVGPTGCGKTTFLNCITKLYEPTMGEILINGEPVNLKKHNVAYIFQEYSTMSWMTVEQNVAFGLKMKRFPKPVIKDTVNEALEMVGLTKYRDYYPVELSTSMLQRVVIARAFAVKPELLLMDEPYGQLDVELRFKLEDELLKLWQQTGTTVIFITHNIEEAVYLSENILVLTNKPTAVKERMRNSLPQPRNVVSPEFIEVRNKVTELIKWW